MPLKSLIAQNINVWINDSGNVEITTEKAIDVSKIISDWYRVKDTISSYEKKIKKKDSIIKQMYLENKKTISQLNSINEYIFKKNREIDSIYEERIKINKKFKNKLSLKIDINSNFKNIYNIQTLSQLEYKINNFYIFVRNQSGIKTKSDFKFGAGYIIF